MRLDDLTHEVVVITIHVKVESFKVCKCSLWWCQAQHLKIVKYIHSDHSGRCTLFSPGVLLVVCA